ncbi:MAG TPA: response regulator [Polyangia bacterium]|nr:response regulator [Polyangia bacterium]
MSDPNSTEPVVFIVDDDHGLRESVSGLLRSEGVRTAGFADGVEALAALRQGLRPSAILLDIAMPRMDGWDFRDAQRSDPALKDVPVVILTASGFSEGTIKLQFGDVPILRKPFHPGELVDTITRVLGVAAADPDHN